MRRPRSLAALLAVATAVLLTTASSSPAAVTLGETSGNVNNCVDTQIYTQGTLAEGPSYIAASPGVIVSWSTAIGAVPGSSQLVVLRSGAGATDFIPSQVDQVRDFTAINQVNTVTGVRIPIAAGERLGLFIPPAATGFCELVGKPGSTTIFTGTTTPTIGVSRSFDGDDGDTKLDASAVVEPDADGDGYGDETQDGCPANGAVHDKCPATKKKKCKKKKKGKKRSSAAAKKKKGCKKKKKRK